MWRTSYHIVALAVAFVCLRSELRACLVCVADPLETVLVSELENAREVVLAVPVEGGEEGQYKIETIYRGSASLKPGTEVKASLPLFSTDRGKIGTDAVLLTRSDEKSDWIMRAPAAKHHIAFFEAVQTLPKAGSMDLLSEINRALFFASYLHDEEAIFAKAGAAELTRLPYSMLKKIRKAFDPEKLRRAIQNPAEADRYALYYTLLGICGDGQDAVAIRQTVDSMWKNNGWRNLGALLTAQLELGGADVVDQIEARYFRDEARTLPEVEQAVLALRVHGDTDASISRERTTLAFRRFLDDREPLSFIVIPDLARWQDWESKQKLLELLERRGADSAEIRRSINGFLIVCPEAP